MDDSCAVCADNLEWVAYGVCGHREVCSTCVIRIRFICNDLRCCICKTESNVIFVTKALGDYTEKIKNFSVFPSQAREGRAGSYWYHEDTRSFFDDVDHYRVIKAMCRLSCNVCDKMEEDQSRDGVKRRGKFRNIEHLKGHLFHMHRLVMCSLCLEGRKVFISEQNLYSRAQLNQHLKTGDSEVDGTENERAGFMGHPMCEFCKTSFYGETELYSHMSTEHYTCHICQRQHPGQYNYYKNYDNLEIHFRRDHYLCEDEACLANKFVVFRSVAELKRHNTIEHGGLMSRAQMPTSFQYRQSNEDYRYGRGRVFRPQPNGNDYQLSMNNEASLETVNVPSASSTTDSESSTYNRALGVGSMVAHFQESSFPPLPIVPGTNRQNSEHSSENSTKEARLWCQKNGKKKNSSSAQAWVATSCRPTEASSSSSQNGKTTNIAAASSVVTGNAVAQMSYVSSSHAQTRTHSSTTGILITSSSQTSLGKASRIHHSSATPNLANGGYSESESSVSAAQRHKQSSSSRVLRIVEEVRTINKSLAEKVLSCS
ncbi:E3 ubiquitin-protein ligase hel2-like isoform X1 [Hibiscus syriacus]|uniref:E3 ubiquitin-protein ligase hel2-like isoform X1 n=1 Tax=Hibiscus syriacus TaxID=106335 RepID=UPI00192394E5|nr:E3 ubiquitin-protein ligase hel2-like isoform X1 [Hibiscus syriacus]